MVVNEQTKENNLTTFSLIMTQTPIIHFLNLNIFLGKRSKLTRFIYVRAQATVLKGAKYGKAVIHKSIKRQLIRQWPIGCSSSVHGHSWQVLRAYTATSYLP